MLKTKYFKTAAAAALLALMAGGVNAASVSCPGTVITTDREFGADPADSCVAYGPGNFDNSPLGIAMAPGLLDKTDTAGPGASGVEITFTQSAVTTPFLGWTGTFSILVPAGMKIVNMYLALKSGEGQLNPDWALFKLADNTLSGTWFIDNSANLASPGGGGGGGGGGGEGGGNQALSHMNVYGTLVPAAVPVPAAGFMLLGALGGLAMVRRRRKTA